MRRASGESSTGTQDTPAAHLWFTTGLHHHEADGGKLLSGETVMAARPFNDHGRSANGNRRCVCVCGGKGGRASPKGFERGLNQRGVWFTGGIKVNPNKFGFQSPPSFETKGGLV